MGQIIRSEIAPIVVSSTHAIQPSLRLDPMAVYLRTLAESGRRSMARGLERAARIVSNGVCGASQMPWHLVRKNDLQRLRAELIEPTSHLAARGDGKRLAPKTINLIMAAVKGVLREAVDLDMLPVNEWIRCTQVKGVRDDRPMAGRALEFSEMSALIGACRKTIAGKRDRAILAILFSGGLRRTESVMVKVADWLSESRRLRVEEAKGGNVRDVYLSEGARAAVDEWIEARGPQPGPLLVSIRHGRVGDRRLSTQAIYDSLQRLARRAGVAKFSPHDLRRSCASLMLEAGADLFSVQRQMGHKNAACTAKYDRRGDKAQMEAAKKLDGEISW
jgi:integrase